MLRDTFDQAVAALRNGRLVVYPTDTLLGLGANAKDPSAVSKILEAKQRPSGMPLSVAVSSLPELEQWATLTPPALAWARRHLPGPFTLLAHASPAARSSFAESVVGPGGTLGLRVPDHPVARELARRAGPITSTSVNLHGESPAKTIAQARSVLGSLASVYLPAKPSPSGTPSMLVDFRWGGPRMIHRR